MNYVIPDIHNDNRRLKELLKQISFGSSDHLILLGDLFDRCSYDPDPVGVYHTVLSILDHCTIVAGNHDIWLADYILKYFGQNDKARMRYKPYHYNSFELLKERLTEADMVELAEWLLKLPLQYKISIDGKQMLFAHAMTSNPEAEYESLYYLMGCGSDEFYKYGIEGYLSFCGHTDSGFFSKYGGRYMDEDLNSIWINDKENVYMMDCGCGYSDGRLSCICLETMKRVYVE